MTKTALSETITGTCENCGAKEAEIFRDNGRCEDCDGQFYPCVVCREEQHRDDHCRHIFEDSNFEWQGSGVGIPDKYALKGLKRSLFKLFDLMPDGFAVDLRVAIKSGRFHTWLVAPLIGGGGVLSLYGMPDRDGQSMLHKWGDDLIEIGHGNHAEETSDGYHWLASLYDRKTIKANRATVTWIDEWLGTRR